MNKLLVFFVIFIANTSFANNFIAEYRVSTTGIKIGHFSWSLNVNGNIYQTEINLKNSVALNSFIDLLSKKFKKRSQINTFLDKEKIFRYQ